MSHSLMLLSEIIVRLRQANMFIWLPRFICFTNILVTILVTIFIVQYPENRKKGKVSVILKSGRGSVCLFSVDTCSHISICRHQIEYVLHVPSVILLCRKRQKAVLSWLLHARNWRYYSKCSYHYK